MITDGMILDNDGLQLADDFASEDQDELAYYAAWVTRENVKLRKALNVALSGDPEPEDIMMLQQILEGQDSDS